MKELTIEEKAKRFDEAIKKAKSKIKNDKDHVLYEDDVVEIFPELKESEGEKMIQYFKDLAPFDKADELYEKYGFSHKDAIAWLEKQGEQKPAWSEEDDTFFKAIIRDIENTQYISEDAKKDRITWLKSLRPQNTWKPSDEQMKLLREVQQALLGKDCHNRFVNFMYELKRLREE